MTYQNEAADVDYAAVEKANSYGLQKSCAEPLVSRLRRQKTQAEGEVARLTELIQLLEANPSTERILQLLNR